MTETRACEHCGGTGHIVVGAGLAALQDRYPELPIREMARRGWIDDGGDGENVALCDASFLRFWDAESHDEVQRKLTDPFTFSSLNNARRSRSTFGPPMSQR